MKPRFRRETLIGETKPVKSTETKLLRISNLSREDHKLEFNWLMPHFNKESLMCCFNELSGKKAVGIDKKTKEEYTILCFKYRL